MILLLPRALKPALLVMALGFAQPAAAQPQPAQDRVAVLDAGTFIVVEARNAPLGEVLARVGERLGVAVTNTEVLDLTRVVDGRRAGPALEVMRWLVPDANVLLLFEGQPQSTTLPPRLERITFIGRGQGGGVAGATPDRPAPANDAAAAAAAAVAAAVTGGGRRSGGPQGDGDLRIDGSKPEDAPGAPPARSTDALGVAEQLRAATPEAQLAERRAAYRVGSNEPPPNFLRPGSDAAQTTLEQQQQRSQALAVEQLRALMEAMRAACTGTVC